MQAAMIVRSAFPRFFTRTALNNGVTRLSNPNWISTLQRRNFSTTVKSLQTQPQAPAQSQVGQAALKTQIPSSKLLHKDPQKLAALKYPPVRSIPIAVGVVLALTGIMTGINATHCAMLDDFEGLRKRDPTQYLQILQAIEYYFDYRPLVSFFLPRANKEKEEKMIMEVNDLALHAFFEISDVPLFSTCLYILTAATEQNHARILGQLRWLKNQGLDLWQIYAGIWSCEYLPLLEHFLYFGANMAKHEPLARDVFMKTQIFNDCLTFFHAEKVQPGAIPDSIFKPLLNLLANVSETEEYALKLATFEPLLTYIKNVIDNTSTFDFDQMGKVHASKVIYSNIQAALKKREIPLPPPLVTKKEVTRPSLDMTLKEYLVPTAVVAAVSPLWAGLRSAFATRNHPVDLKKKWIVRSVSRASLGGALLYTVMDAYSMFRYLADKYISADRTKAGLLRKDKPERALDFIPFGVLLWGIIKFSPYVMLPACMVSFTVSKNFSVYDIRAEQMEGLKNFVRFKLGMMPDPALGDPAAQSAPDANAAPNQ